MSKEQIPITAEEFFNNGGDIIESCFGTKYSKTDLNPIKFAEQYAQAKVLEALEREVIKAIFKTDKSGFKNLSMKEAKEYYETEVKPNYER